MSTSQPSNSQSSWAPGAVTDHLGKPIPANRDFFVQPPREIGTILSAFSDARQGRKLWSVPARLGLTVGIAAVVFLAIFIFFPRDTKAPPEAPMVAGAFPAILILVVGIWFSTRPKLVSFVGAEGIALYSTKGAREQATAAIVPFARLRACYALSHARDGTESTQMLGATTRTGSMDPSSRCDAADGSRGSNRGILRLEASIPCRLRWAGKGTPASLSNLIVSSRYRLRFDASHSCPFRPIAGMGKCITRSKEMPIERWSRMKKGAQHVFGYEFQCIGTDGQQLMRLKGEFIETPGGRQPRHAHDFVTAAEKAWRRYRGNKLGQL